MSDDNKVRVLYIASWGRSGSTIISNILGQLSGYFSVGEIRFIWERGFSENHLCGCGEHFLNCNTWKEIIQYAYGDAHIDANVMNDLTLRFTRTLRVIWLIITKIWQGRVSRELQEYLNVLEKLYKAIVYKTNCQVIVDSSKFPLYGAILRLIPSFDVYIIHLVRDSRAVAYSWQNPKSVSANPIKEFTPLIGPTLSTLRWAGWNMVIKYLGSLDVKRYHFLRYEDFTKDPRLEISKIVNLLGVIPSHLPFENEHTVFLERTHTISGNPNRFDTGRVHINLDVRWCGDMNSNIKALVTILSAPLLRYYGYKLWQGPTK